MFQNINLLTKAMNASWKRNEVISNNIANANTPGFKRTDVKFEELLKDYLDGKTLRGTTTHERHMPIGVKNIEQLQYKLEGTEGYSTRRDANNVDIDVEMAELAKNQITFNTLATQINSHFQRLRLAINEGKR
jgi:flagellar basal-body rod protein FlgB